MLSTKVRISHIDRRVAPEVIQIEIRPANSYANTMTGTLTINKLDPMYAEALKCKEGEFLAVLFAKAS